MATKRTRPKQGSAKQVAVATSQTPMTTQLPATTSVLTTTPEPMATQMPKASETPAPRISDREPVAADGALANHPLLRVGLDGVVVIEASAGTGKTWTISGLYLRLLIERALEPKAILVVTFTIAATAELKERIRGRLHALREALDRDQAVVAQPADGRDGAMHEAAVREPAASQPGHADEDPLIVELIRNVPDRAALRRRVALAVETFDEAAIHTIHGFCQRVLADHAFESASPFVAEIAPDEVLVAEASQDFWRREVRAIHPLWAAHLAQTSRSPQALAQNAGELLRNDRVQVVPPASVDLASVCAAFTTEFQAARSQWGDVRAEVEALLKRSVGLHGTYYKPEHIDGYVRAVDAYFGVGRAFDVRGEFDARAVAPQESGVEPVDAQLPAPDGLEGRSLERLSQSFLREKTKKNHTTPAHPFFVAADELLQQAGDCERALKDAWIGLVSRFAAYAREVLDVRKQELGVQSFDDLLRRVERALAADADGALARAIGERYGAALVDEFQDTDDLQYAILKRLFVRSGCALFLVGDPKQAIYAFRGADVFTYLRARDDATKQVALEINRRSTPYLVHAMNVLFGRVAAPFAADKIDYPQAQARADYDEACVLAAPRAPLAIWYVEGAFNKDEVEHKGALRRRIASATAHDIARLLRAGERGESYLQNTAGRRPLHGSDIAVIVRQHSEADLIRAALAAHGLACVTFGQESVFASDEARELAQVIHAIARPGDERQVRGALATSLFGRSAAELAQLERDARAWEAELARFRVLHDALRDHGVARVMLDIIERQQVPGRLLGYIDGERRLTNFRHLAELLHGVARERGFDALALARFLARAVIDPPPADEAAQVRLESDERLVRVITIHAAKGLEFPIVYCPFLWDARQQPTRPPLRFHARDAAHTPSVDLGSTDFDVHKKIAAEEGFAEQLRLTYVALTRAKHHCAIVWGAAKQGAQSALAWLLHGPRKLEGEFSDARNALEARLKGLPAAQLLAEVESLVRSADGCIGLQTFPEHDEQSSDATIEAGSETDAAESITPDVEADARRVTDADSESSSGSGGLIRAHGRAARFAGVVPTPRRTTSFTALHAGSDLDIPDHDAFVRPDIETMDAPAVADAILAFPRGANAGSCLHTVFERVMQHPRPLSGLARPTLQEWAHGALLAYGLSETLAPVVVDLVLHTLQAPLQANGMLSLAKIDARRRLTELAFQFALAGDSGKGERPLALLDQVVRMHRGERGLPERVAGGWGATRSAAFMKGFIDLVVEHDGRYAIVDYKSNWLGPTLDSYAPMRLDAAIAAEHYDLQYLLYTLALDRWLATRLRDYDYERHFGGVYYLFVRGMRTMGPAGHGVYFARPSTQTMAQLRRLVAPRAER